MSGFIYAIECSGRIKIGFSEDPERRFNKVASDAPFPCDLLGYWKGSKSEELDVQDKFRDLRVHGEWFASTDGLLAFISECSVMPEQRGKRFAVSDDDTALAAWRKAQRKPMKPFADEMGVTQATWSRWEAGKTRIPAEVCPALEKFTGVPRCELRPDIFAEATE